MYILEYYLPNGAYVTQYHASKESCIKPEAELRYGVNTRGYCTTLYQTNTYPMCPSVNEMYVEYDTYLLHLMAVICIRI